MAKWIELPILCNTSNGAVLKDLGIDNNSAYETRTGMLNLDKIVGFYPSESPEETIISYSDTEFTVVVPYSEIVKVLCN